MQLKELNITRGENSAQSASIEYNDKMIEYDVSQPLSYSDVISVYRGLNVISEFYDVCAVATVTSIGICAVALGQNIEAALKDAMDSNPIDFMSSTVVFSNEINSDIAKMLRNTHIVVAPAFTKNASDFFETHEICYVTIKTPLKDYKNYISNEILQTPLGTLVQSPNSSELNKDSFKIVTKLKPTVEQIEDAVFAWKVAKHVNSRALVVAKDLKTVAIAQGLQSASIEYALDYSCDSSKDSVLAADMCITLHDLHVAAQGRISLIILPDATPNIVAEADKYNMIIITTGFTNLLY